MKVLSSTYITRMKSFLGTTFEPLPQAVGGLGGSQKSFETFWRSGDYVFYPIGFKSHVTWFFFTAGGLLRAFHLNWNNSRVEIVKLNNK
jgi:hypothetical protein